MNLKLNRMCPSSSEMGSGRLKSKSREDRQNSSQMEAHGILVAPTHAWSLHVS